MNTGEIVNISQKKEVMKHIPYLCDQDEMQRTLRQV